MNNTLSKKEKEDSFACESLIDGVPASEATDVTMDESRYAHVMLEPRPQIGTPADGSGANNLPYAAMAAPCGLRDDRWLSSTNLVTKEGVVRAGSPKLSEVGTSNNNKSGVDNGSSNGVDSDSRFDVLVVEDGMVAPKKTLPVVNANNNKGLKVVSNQPRILQNSAYMKLNPTKKSKEVGRRDDKVTPTQVNVDQDLVIISQNNVGSSDRHMAITLMESKYDTPGSTLELALAALRFYEGLFQRSIDIGDSFKVPGDSIYEFVRGVFEDGTLPVDINRTLLMLIPKVTLPEKMSQFRPISREAFLLPVNKLSDGLLLETEIGLDSR
ncbi:hypothetical protein GQ457_02G022270 [Hibiscus cannabinus]